MGSQESGVYLLRTDAQGDSLWSKTYNENQHAGARELDLTRDGGCVIAGSIWQPSLAFDIYVLRTDSSGDTLWARRYGGPDYESLASVRPTSDGGFILAGSTESFGAGLSDVYVVKTNASGDTAWTAVYGGAANDYGREAWETPDGGYIITGWTGSFGPPFGNMYLVKTGSDPAGVYVDDPAGVASDLNVMPNPSAAGVRIEYRLSSRGEASAGVYDLRGRQVRALVAGARERGAHSFLWDGADSRGERVSPGVYFVHLTHGAETAIRKVVILK